MAPSTKALNKYLLLNVVVIIVNGCEQTNNYQRYYGNCNVNINTCLTYHHFKFKWNANAQVWSGEYVQTPSSYDSETGAIEHAVQQLISTLSSCNCETYYYNTAQCELQIRFCFSYKTPKDVTLNHPQYEAWAISIHDANIYGHSCCDYNKSLSIQSAIHAFVTEETCATNNITTNRPNSNMFSTTAYTTTVKHRSTLSTSAHVITTSYHSNMFQTSSGKLSTASSNHHPSTTSLGSGSMAMVLSIPACVFVFCVCFLIYTLRKRKRSTSKEKAAALISSEQESNIQESMIAGNNGIECQMEEDKAVESKSTQGLELEESESSSVEHNEDDEKAEMISFDTVCDDVANISS